MYTNSMYHHNVSNDPTQFTIKKVFLTFTNKKIHNLTPVFSNDEQKTCELL